MTNKLLTILLITLSGPFYAQWLQQNSGSSANLNDVYSLNRDNVIVVGTSGTILKTTDGGVHWEQKTSGSVQDLTKVQFINANTGFAVGAMGTLLKTNDAGESWTTIETGETAYLYGISAVDDSIFYIAGENGLLKKTDDGGATFTIQDALTDQTIKNVQFLNATTGYAQSEVLIKTIDGGNNWTTVFDQGLESFYFVNENTGFVLQSGGLLKTTDGAQSLAYAGSSGGAIITDIFALNENTVWELENSNTLCGCSSHCIIRNGIIDAGINAGTYESIRNCGFGTVADGIPFEGIHFADETTGYAVGWFGAIYKNTTGTMLGVDKTELKDAITVFPNPASDRITIAFRESTTTVFSVDLTNSIGAKIFSNSYDAENSATINVSALPKGVYFLTVASGDTRQTQKVIVN